MAFVEIEGLTKRFGAEIAVNRVSLSVKQGEFVTLLGPSGCGKTTTLRCVAGLEHPDEGTIRIADQVVASAEQSLFLPPEKRNIGMVFQSYAVWPHMTVFDNVAYGLRVRHTRGDALRRQTMQALELVGLDHLAERFATKLSGGQKQRVALARAIVYRPEVILFDEPLSNLDAKLREQLRDELARLQREVGITSIYVTHDQSEALVMSDRVVVMNLGVIQQVGDPQSMYVRPANAFVANFLGVANLLRGTVRGREGDTYDVNVPIGDGLTPLRLRAVGTDSAATGASVTLCVRPEDLQLHTERQEAQPTLNVVEGHVIDSVYLGNFLDCQVRVGTYEVGVQVDHYEQLAPGQTVYLSFRADHGLCLTS